MSLQNHCPFQIFTTFRYDPVNSLVPPTIENSELSDNFYMPLLHYSRLITSCKYFNWERPVATIQGSRGLADFLAKINEYIRQDLALNENVATSLRIKVIVDQEGSFVIEGQPTPYIDPRNLYPIDLTHVMNRATAGPNYSPIIYILQVSRKKVNPYPHTRIKTTCRQHYEIAQQEVGIWGKLDGNEVLLLNTANEVMEGSYCSVYFYRRGQWVTPPLQSGGQDGTTRKWALERRLCVEGIIKFDSLVDGELCCISNGVRGYQCAEINL